MNPEESTVLEEIGFSKGEIKVYFALLELGEATVGPLSKDSKVTVSKVYPILDKLKDKGLITSVIKDNKSYFQAFNPKNLLNFLEEKRKKITQEEAKLKKIIPLLTNRQEKEKKSAVVYEGFQGMRTLYNEIIDTLKNNKEDFISFTLGEEEYSHKESEHFFNEYDIKRKSAGIKIKLLGHTSQKPFLVKRIKEDKNIFIKYLPYQMPTGVIIYGNKVATLTWGKIPTAFVIESKKTYESYKKFFEDMWTIAKS